MVKNLNYAPLNIEGVYNEKTFINIACTIMVLDADVCNEVITKVGENNYCADYFFIEVHYDPKINRFIEAGLFYNIEFLGHIDLLYVDKVIDCFKKDGSSIDAFNSILETFSDVSPEIGGEDRSGVTDQICRFNG